MPATMPFGRNHPRAAQSIDVLVEVGGAPDDDHPDRQHESDCQNCEHLQFLPAEIFCRGLAHFTPSRALEPSQSNPYGMDIRSDVDPARGEFLSKIDGVEHHKVNDHRCEGNAEHVTHIMPGYALARLLGRHDGALLALQVPLSEYGAVLRRVHGHSLNAVAVVLRQPMGRDGSSDNGAGTSPWPVPAVAARIARAARIYAALSCAFNQSSTSLRT